MTFLNTLHYTKLQNASLRMSLLQFGKTCLFIVIVLFFKKFNAPRLLFTQV